MNQALSHQQHQKLRLSVSVFTKDGWKAFPKSGFDFPYPKPNCFHMSIREDGGETFYELIHFPHNGWTVIYRTRDNEQPISERSFLFRGTLTNVKDYETIMRVCEIKNCN